MSSQQTSDALREWVKVKRQLGLSDAHVQMARELGMNPSRLSGRARVPPGQHIEECYLKRFQRASPDPVVPVRELLREALAREKTQAREQRRRKRRSELDHLEAARTSLLAIRRLLPGGPAHDASDEADDPPAE